MKLQKKVSTTWTPILSYIVGIIATDGNLSIDGRHIVIVSKDKQLLTDIKKSLRLTITIGKRVNKDGDKEHFVLQIGDRHFYLFLESIGLTVHKSKTINRLLIPYYLFNHFLRGCLDGDGNIDVYKHKESKQKQLRIRLASASIQFLHWIDSQVKNNTKVKGGWIYSQNNKECHVLTYGKKDSIMLLQYMYVNKPIYLKRKYALAKEFLP